MRNCIFILPGFCMLVMIELMSFLDSVYRYIYYNTGTGRHILTQTVNLLVFILDFIVVFEFLKSHFLYHRWILHIK